MIRRRKARRVRAVFLGVVLLAVSAACGEPTAPPAVAQITELPRALSPAERHVLGASNAFAFSLAGELLPAPTGNLFYSPLSVSMVLGMLLNGADRETYAQIQSVLGIDATLSQEEINQGYADLIDLLVGLDPSVTVELGNSLWTRNGFPVDPAFMQRVRSAFDAEAADVDFGDPQTLPRINRWASDATHGRIEKIFDQLPANVVMVLLNAIYFDASWTKRFERAKTERAPFTRADGSSVTVDLMRMEGELTTGWADGVTLVDLPYSGGAFSMVVALPDEGTSVADVARGLTPERWDGWLDALAERRAILRLPRFELEWEARLNEPLQALGMTDAFDGGRADFSRLTGGGVWLDLVKQKAFVSVDEEGTEAAAVTGAVVVESAPQEIRVDRPFLFVLRERLTGTVLFLGVVGDPTR